MRGRQTVRLTDRLQIYTAVVHRNSLENDCFRLPLKSLFLTLRQTHINTHAFGQMPLVAELVLIS